MEYTSVSQANIEQVESLLELLSNVYDYTIKDIRTWTQNQDTAMMKKKESLKDRN